MTESMKEKDKRAMDEYMTDLAFEHEKKKEYSLITSYVEDKGTGYIRILLNHRESEARLTYDMEVKELIRHVIKNNENPFFRSRCYRKWAEKHTDKFLKLALSETEKLGINLDIKGETLDELKETIYQEMVRVDQQLVLQEITNEHRPPTREEIASLSPWRKMTQDELENKIE